MRTSRIRTMEHTFVVIPNQQITGDMLINHSTQGATRRIERPTHFADVEASKSAPDGTGIEIPFPHVQRSVDAISNAAVLHLTQLERTPI